MFYVYVLYSFPFDKIYIGFTSDLEARLKSHNELATKGWTIKFRPWKIVFQEPFTTSSGALISQSYTVKQPGYAYMYVSNEQAYQTDVFIDDVTTTFTPSPVVQQEDFYPGGATFNSYSRENSVPNNYLYQHKEYQSDLSLNLYDFHWRQYDPWGMFTTTKDPHAENYFSASPYSWAGGNPMKYVDPDGKDIWISYTANVKGKDVTQSVQYKNGNLYNANGSKYKGANTFLRTVQGQLNSIVKLDASVAKMVNGLVKSELSHNITYNAELHKQTGNKVYENRSSFKEVKTADGQSKVAVGSTINFDPYGTKTVRGDAQDPRAGLAHELSHSSDLDNATERQGKTSNGIELDEVQAVNVENKVRSKIGSPQRTTYEGKEIPKELLEKND